MNLIKSGRVQIAYDFVARVSEASTLTYNWVGSIVMLNTSYLLLFEL